jgi:hypothetical protein
MSALEASWHIFREFEDACGELRRFLSFLQERFPGYRFQLVSLQASLGESLCLTDAKGRVFPRKDLLASVIPVPEMEATLIVSANGGGRDPGLGSGFRLALETGIELFLAENRLRESEELLAVQKRQADRTAKVLEEKYMDILAENQRSHEEMGKQQALYAEKLK